MINMAMISGPHFIPPPKKVESRGTQLYSNAALIKDEGDIDHT